MAIESPTTPTQPVLHPPSLRSFSSFESFRSLSIDSLSDELDLPVTEEGLRHSSLSLKAKKYKQPAFAADLAAILTSLRIPTWHTLPGPILPQSISIYKVSGSLTNAVFFVSHPAAKTVLLRVYGPSSASLISRPRELHTLHVLSSKYHFGPTVFGTFENGRVEEYFDSSPLTVQDMRNPVMSGYIAARMSELHQVDIDSVELDSDWDIVGVRKNIRSWVRPARQVLELVDEKTRKAFDMEGFVHLWEHYWNWIRKWEKEHGECPRVFAHNDAQYGNLLQLRNPSVSRPAHHQIIVVDFEYASPNPAAFDIANHFHEWTADYHSSTPWLLQHTRYPSTEQRRVFLQAYLTAAFRSTLPPTDDQLDLLDGQVRVWSAASHAMWAVWGLVQARDELETGEPAEFEYLKYAQCRVDAFRREVAELLK